MARWGDECSACDAALYPEPSEYIKETGLWLLSWKLRNCSSTNIVGVTVFTG